MSTLTFILLTILGVLIAVWLYCLAEAGFQKTKAFTRWFFVYFILGIAGVFSILFPLAWLLRSLGKFSPFWFIMDDTRFTDSTQNVYANDYSIFVKDRGETKETFLIALEWHVLRNRVWNLLELFKVPSIDIQTGNNWIEVTEFVIDNLYKNDKNKTKLPQDGVWMVSAGLKYLPTRPNDDIWQVNKGDIISIKTSVLGTGYIWFKIGSFFSFRYSQCKIVNYGFWKGYRTIKLGTGTRYIFTIKHQSIKEWK